MDAAHWLSVGQVLSAVGRSSQCRHPTEILLDGPFELTTAMENYREIGVFDKVPRSELGETDAVQTAVF